MGLLGDFPLPDHWLPVVFVGLMGFAILVYVILDGYDLGIGMLMVFAGEREKDKMIASIGPFWDANETWLVLGAGLLLVAFPAAHGVILNALYFPVAVMLAGLILRGVAFDFRTKAAARYKHLWDRCFATGSLLATLSQGFMLGFYIEGFEPKLVAVLFAALTAICLGTGYGLLGAGWLIIKCEDGLQKKAIRWSRVALLGTAIGLAAVSLTSPLTSTRIFEKWFTMPYFILLAPVPLVTIGLIIVLVRLLGKLPLPRDKLNWAPFAGAAGLFVLGFIGLSYSFFPYIVPERLTIWQAASAPESLMFILVGAVVVLPCIIGYTIYSYRVFWGKADDLSYH